VLESLAEKGFVIVQPSKPIKYVALQPKEALERTKEAWKKKAEVMTERIDKLAGSPLLEELEKIFKRGLNLVEPYDLTGTLKGKHIIDRQMQSIFKSAKKNINIITTEKGAKELHAHHFRVLKKIAKRGVKLKIAAPVRDPQLVKTLSQIGELRVLKAPAGRVCTVDRKHMVMSLTNDKDVHETQDVAFWASSTHAVESIADPLFTQLWNSGSKK
jgi:sugar-specific transcriptional regulator TrmB